MSQSSIRVGGRPIPFDRAEMWISTYFGTEADERSRRPFAYPYYDRFDSDSHPDRLNDGDLLAATLLLPRSSVRAFASLQAARPRLEDALRSIPTDLSLERAVAAGSHDKLIRGYARVLEDGGLKGVRLTVLAKTLHRKRPLFVPLFDQQVKSCYYTRTGDPGFPIRRDRRRKEADFAVLFAECVAHDLTTQRAAWHQLGTLAPATVSPLRLLDVVAWHAGKKGGL